MSTAIFLELFELAEIANFSSDEQEIYECSLKYDRDPNNVVDASKTESIELEERQGVEKRMRSLLIKLLGSKLDKLPQVVVDRINDLLSEALDAPIEEIFGIDALTTVRKRLIL